MKLPNAERERDSKSESEIAQLSFECQRKNVFIVDYARF